MQGGHARARSVLLVVVCGTEPAGCDIGDEGAKALAGALKTNASLTELYLHGEYGGKGAEGSGG